MDSSTTNGDPDGIHTSNTTNMNSNNNDDAPTTFAPTWQPGDASSLAPTNLPVAKAQRAWDRRPQSPFSRAKVRFGKVWKRNANATATHATPSIFGDAHAFQLAGVDSPVKAVKKLRMAGGAEFVSNWEGRGSPKNRRIVTRSNRHEEGLVALEEDEEVAQAQDDEEDVLKVEVEHEDGRVEEVGAEEELAQEGWESESMTEEDPHAWDETLKHLAELREQQEADGVRLDEKGIVAQTTPIDAQADSKAEEASAEVLPDKNAASQSEVDSGHVTTRAEIVLKDATTPKVDEATPDTLRQPPVLPAAQSGPIPDGFVSPVKERRRRPIREVKQANANRRRTLPVNFAAQEATSTEVPAPQIPATGPPAEKEAEVVSTTEEDTNMADVPAVEEADEDQWEDVEQEDSSDDSLRRYEVTPEVMPGEEWIPTVENTPENSPHMPYLQINPDITRLAEEQMAAGKLPNCDLSGPPPRLPSRRSPRRQSSSPLKRSKPRPDAEKPHLVAFTPIKMLNSGLRSEGVMMRSPAQLPSSPDLLEKTNVEDSNLTRSSSAPPEEPQMSPRRPPQPRMSDDTATLQAFINRAAESKNGRNISETAKRESLENRRESNTVRQALASPVPAPVEVLATLDPNSPSPHKQASPALLKHYSDEIKAQQDEEDELAAAASPTRKSSRRSGRTKKKSETLPSSTYSGPTKISVRGTADGVVLKKTEAQEVAQRTRNNTRKNKGTAILPKYRLNRMAQEEEAKGAVNADGSILEDKPTKIRWAETLASFYAGANEPEESMLTDEAGDANAEAADDDTTMTMDLGGIQSSMPPPSETPSKPKLRRLKPSRTASTPAKAASQAEPAAQPAPPADANSQQPTEKKPRTTTRRYRIATPAKPKDLGGLSLLPDDVTTKAEEAAAKKSAASAPEPAPTKKKAVSKLPTPAAIGKENSLIASPPKKKTTRAPAATKTSSITKSVPKLDFAEKQLAIASPAKKGVKAQVLGGGEDAKTPMLPPSLGSPAKKRTRRAG